MQKIYNVLLDMKDDVKNPAFVVNTNDLKTVKLDLEINQDGEPLDLTGATVRLAIRKPDRTTVLQDVTVVDALAGSCEIVLNTQAYILNGTHDAEVMVFYDAETIAVTGQFTYKATRGIMDDDSLESTNEWPAITTTLNDLQATVDDLRVNGTGIDAQARADIAESAQQLDNRGVSVEKYGAKGDGVTDDGTAIQTAINDISSTGGGTVLLMSQHLINTGITIPSNVSIKSAMRTKIKSTSLTGFSAVFSIPKDSKNVEIESLLFDFGSISSCTAIHVYENVSNLRLNKIDFKNFLGSSNAQQNIIRLKTGISGSLSNLSFINIKCIGNGTITDSNGAGRCIRTDSSGVTDLKNYALTIDKIHIEDCYNVDINGNFIVEDFDPFCFQHTGVEGIINISNVTAKNFSKRLFKIQANGVNITNVTADSTLTIPILIGAMANNINISNVVATGNIARLVEFVDANNVNVSNLRVNGTYRSSIATDAILAIFNSSNLNINGVVGEGNSGISIYGKISKNIYINNLNLKLYNTGLYVEDRDVGNTVYTDGEISNVNFNNVLLDISSTTYNAPLFIVDHKTSNLLKDFSFYNVKLIINPVYAFGSVRLNGVQNALINQFTVEDISSLTNPETFKLSGNTDTQIRQLSLKGNPSTKAVILSGTVNLLLTRSKVNNLTLSGTTALVELEKTPATVAYTSSATSAQVTIS